MATRFPDRTMRKKISFIILSSSGSPVRQFTLSRPLLLFLVVALIGTIGAAVHLGRDYEHLRHTAFDNRLLAASLEMQQAVIRDQRRQIRHFARDINQLKEKLVALNGFEKKVRIIANLEVDGHGGESFFGIGGPLPEDLAPGPDLDGSHRALVREMHRQVGQCEQAAAAQEDDFESLLEAMAGQVNLLAATPAIRPVDGWVTSNFGYRTSPFTGLKEFHNGLDIANREGTPVVATADGVVTFAGRKGFLGNILIVDHGHGMVTRYGHLSKILVKRGAKVRRGDTVAAVGASGRSTGPHLHYEVMLNGAPVNPTRYILN